MIYFDKHPSTVRVRHIAKDILQVLQQAAERKLSAKIQTSYLEGLDCEVFVMEDMDFNAFSTSGVNIFIYSGLLKIVDYFGFSDEAIADINGHKVIFDRMTRSWDLDLFN